ncbi:uncharacterized protein LTR77_000376 [Saxophila tyrrhenica]|uniref:WSC domain-containing protein n=1 Tax=Saxophila tyrrhenica TaxID=1690608 RepID=A0AAV9PQC1_9PEZI|nr:hypothetical protein LTR77_000376 [Saxophila tyrrhenica]
MACKTFLIAAIAVSSVLGQCTHSHDHEMRCTIPKTSVNAERDANSFVTSTSTKEVCTGDVCNTIPHTIVSAATVSTTLSDPMPVESTAKSTTTAASPEIVGGPEEIEGCAYIGCYDDDGSAPTLELQHLGVDSYSMTREKCVGTCLNDGWAYAGVEFGRYCFCGNEITSPHVIVTGNKTVPYYGDILQTCSDPKYTCTGDEMQQCGGFLTISIYHCPSMDKDEHKEHGIGPAQ